MTPQDNMKSIGVNPLDLTHVGVEKDPHFGRSVEAESLKSCPQGGVFCPLL